MAAQFEFRVRFLFPIAFNGSEYSCLERDEMRNFPCQLVASLNDNKMATVDDLVENA
jgi:hypothetical protein